jgi:hypothetical protein
MIIWINGGFGAGKTTLAAELHRRLPEAIVYNPEDVGLMLWKWMPPNGDFQHLPSWRELTEADAGVLRERLNARVTSPGRDWDQAARESGMTGVDEMVAAAARQPTGTLILRSDKLTPAELADEVLATVRLRQDQADSKRK